MRAQILLELLGETVNIQETDDDPFTWQKLVDLTKVCINKGEAARKDITSITEQAKVK